MTFFVKVTGHELVKRREKDDAGAWTEYEQLKVTLRGAGDDEKTRVQLFVDPSEVAQYPLGEKGEIGFEIRQQRLELEK